MKWYPWCFNFAGFAIDFACKFSPKDILILGSVCEFVQWNSGTINIVNTYVIIVIVNYVTAVPDSEVSSVKTGRLWRHSLSELRSDFVQRWFVYSYMKHFRKRYKICIFIICCRYLFVFFRSRVPDDHERSNIVLNCGTFWKPIEF